MADSSEKDKSDKGDVDDELSELLDSAVKDFGTAKEDEKPDTVAKPTPPDSLWSDDFLKATAARFEQNMASLFSPGSDGVFNIEQLGENIQRLADATTQASGVDASPDNEFSAIIAQTLRNLGENSEILNNQFSEEEMMNILGSFANLGDAGGEGAEMLPFMQKMMQNLLSKEILHPALSSIVEKYPSWLEENKDKLSNEEYERYSKQNQLMKVICTELEKETPEDSEITKTNRYERVLALMQEMQDCGSPPSDLVGEFGQLLDEQGRPRMPQGMSPDQCVIQ